jgi:hypothetical protein
VSQVEAYAGAIHGDGECQFAHHQSREPAVHRDDRVVMLALLEDPERTRCEDPIIESPTETPHAVQHSKAEANAAGLARKDFEPADTDS